MDVRRERVRNKVSSSYYISGTAVRKAKPFSDDNVKYSIRKVRNKKKALREHEKEVNEIKQKEVSSQMNRGFFFSFSCCFLLISLCFMFYLKVNTKIENDLIHIEKLQKELDILKNENDGLESSIKSYRPDLDYVYKVATEELGMIEADNSQIKTYINTEKEYVRQYEELPQ